MKKYKFKVYETDSRNVLSEVFVNANLEKEALKKALKVLKIKKVDYLGFFNSSKLRYVGWSILDDGYDNCKILMDRVFEQESEKRIMVSPNDELYFFKNFKNELINLRLLRKKDKLTVKFETEKAQLFAINDTPLFWVPKKLIKKKGRTFYINECFDIKKALTYQGG